MKIVKTPVSIGAREKEQWLASLRRFGEPEQVCFMDIETTGFSRMYDTVYLTGFLYYEDGVFMIEQHLAEDQRDEPTVVESYCERLDEAAVMITFNGEMFDLPFMESRHKMLHAKAPLPTCKSVDLYRRYRPCAKIFGWENCKLKTIERFLDIDRADPFTGGQLIEVFEEYARTGGPELEQVLLLHNFEDILNMPRLLRIEAYLAALRSAKVEEVRLMGEHHSSIGLRVTLSEWLTISFEGEIPLYKNANESIRFRTEAESPVLYVSIPVVEGQYYYYLPNPEDYYYLPESDSIIHRSLSDGLDNVQKRRATTKNCRIARKGRFAVGREELESIHTFRDEKSGTKSKLAYYELEELLQQIESGSPEWKERWIRSLLVL